MPRGDGTGPQGQGPQTCRGMGSCGTGDMSVSEENVGFFRRLGRMFGLGRSGQGNGMKQGRDQGRGMGRVRNR